MIGYTPQDGTFAKPGEKPSLHKISIRVTRPGLQVKTRKTFIGVTDPPPAPGAVTPAQQLVQAATSPFGATDIALHATTLPGYSPEQGLFLRALLHIDARRLTFAAADGSAIKSAAVDVLGMVFDREGTEVAHLTTGVSMDLARDAADAGAGEGLAYMLRIPLPRAGAYQVRFAVRDQHSGVLGSAGEFVDVPDVAGGVFALSGIVLRNDDDENGAVKTADDIRVTPAQALAVYRPGTGLSYAYEIYNAALPVVATMTIWRGADRVLAADPVTLAPPTGSAGRFSAAGGIRLGERLPAGNYVLQIAAAKPDAQQKSKHLTAVQRIGFEVR